MRVLKNKSHFVRLDGSSILDGLFLVIAQNNVGDRLLMDVNGKNHWVTDKEMSISFEETDRSDTSLFFGKLKKLAFDRIKMIDNANKNVIKKYVKPL